jgi:16S rRNA A1518/A1519 N6-dimethyltransferase RsmA/KsgA/DIM1 with predicted DNA glycosylase/AP lyase activity
VTLQQEVAARLTAKPGHKDFGLLTLWTQLRYDVAIRKTVSPTCFYPAPGVSSTILTLVRRERPADVTTGEVFSVRGSGFDRPADDSSDRHFFYALTKFAFAHRRKQLKTILCDAVVTTNSMHGNFSPGSRAREGVDSSGKTAERDSSGKVAERDSSGSHGVTATATGNNYRLRRPLTTQLHLSAENVLAAFQKLGIDPRTRPEDMSVELWYRLAKALKDEKSQRHKGTEAQSLP